MYNRSSRSVLVIQNKARSRNTIVILCIISTHYTLKIERGAQHSWFSYLQEYSHLSYSKKNHLNIHIVEGRHLLTSYIHCSAYSAYKGNH